MQSQYIEECRKGDKRTGENCLSCMPASLNRVAILIIVSLQERALTRRTYLGVHVVAATEYDLFYADLDDLHAAGQARTAAEHHEHIC